jgi:hypothetical protein
MSLLPYDLFYRRSFSSVDEWADAQSWDTFISAFNTSHRVNEPFRKVNARNKVWLIHQEYGFTSDELPEIGRIVMHDAGDESDCVGRLFDADISIDYEKGLCVDITGFMRPHLMYLLRYLQHRGVSNLDVIYTEPIQYKKLNNTKFAGGSVPIVRQVAGFQGVHDADVGRDLLIVGVGYEHELIKFVAESRMSANKIPLYSFPPLQADFYQEGILQVERAAESVSAVEDAPFHFAPAYDPFETAAVIHRLVDRERKKRQAKNIYLSPIATKVQAMGFALYYLYECIGKEVSIVYPFAPSYDKDTALGISRIWRYTVELP